MKMPDLQRPAPSYTNDRILLVRGPPPTGDDPIPGVLPGPVAEEGTLISASEETLSGIMTL